MLFEKRKYERFEFKRELTVHAAGPSVKKPIQYYATSLNISQGGILFYTIAEFKEKVSCVVNFKSNRMESVETKGLILREVKENRPEGLKENDKLYALQFNKPITHDRLMEILARMGE